jgi:hypothetical protein
MILTQAEEQMLAAIHNFFHASVIAELRSLGEMPRAHIECKLSLPGFPAPVAAICAASAGPSSVCLVFRKTPALDQCPENADQGDGRQVGRWYSCAPRVEGRRMGKGGNNAPGPEEVN